ncbi:inositol-1,4,5-trisphosphate 5-phosphatase [Trifolium repens]|nr:inositol-1,4,5-trisphosphate 5-phosphatase [Trifolium repens]
MIRGRWGGFETLEKWVTSSFECHTAVCLKDEMRNLWVGESGPDNGKLVIGYTQKTWKLSSGEPMHSESGYWHPKPNGTIEVVIAQSNGLVEVQKGRFSTEDNVIQLQSELVGYASKLILQICGTKH